MTTFPNNLVLYQDDAYSVGIMHGKYVGNKAKLYIDVIDSSIRIFFNVIDGVVYYGGFDRPEEYLENILINKEKEWQGIVNFLRSIY